MRRFKKILKIIGFTLLGIIALAGLYYAYVSYSVNQRANKQYRFPKEDLAFIADSALVQTGRHLVEIKGCTDCHSSDLGGKVFLNEDGLGLVSATNLTRGQGGIGASYTNADWMMAFRHGVNREGKPLWIMPSHETVMLSKADLKAVIAYCQSVPPVNRTLPANEAGPIMKVMTHLDKIPLFPVEKIDHNLAAPDSVEQRTGIALGKYLSVSCEGCHRPNLNGGPSPVPGMLASPDITSTGNVGSWTLAQFRTTLKTGKTPSGHQLKNEDMPWQMTAKYTDAEIESVYQYLKSIK